MSSTSERYPLGESDDASYQRREAAEQEAIWQEEARMNAEYTAAYEAYRRGERPDMPDYLDYGLSADDAYALRVEVDRRMWGLAPDPADADAPRPIVPVADDL